MGSAGEWESRVAARGLVCAVLSTEYWPQGTGYWLLGTENWLLATGYWPLAPGYWLPITGHRVRRCYCSPNNSWSVFNDRVSITRTAASVLPRFSAICLLGKFSM